MRCRRWWIAWTIAAALTAGFTALNVHTTSVSEMFQGAAEELRGSRIARTAVAQEALVEKAQAGEREAASGEHSAAVGSA